MREGELLWEPPKEALERSRMARFIRDRGFSDYHELWRWSVEDLEGVWAAVWDEFEVIGGAYELGVLAASAERLSEHPLAQASVAAARAEGLTLEQPEEFADVVTEFLQEA